MNWLLLVTALASFSRGTESSTSIIPSSSVTNVSVSPSATNVGVSPSVTNVGVSPSVTNVSGGPSTTDSPSLSATLATPAPMTTAAMSPAPASSSVTNVNGGLSTTPAPTSPAAMSPAPTTPAAMSPAPTTQAAMSPAPTTSSSTPQIPSDAKEFKGEFALNETFDENLKNQTSRAFIELAEKVIKVLEAIFELIIGFLKVFIRLFKPGSTVVEFQVIFQSNATVTEEEAAKSIKDAVTSDGKLGELTIVENSIKVSQIGGPTTEPPTTDMDSMQRNLFILMLVGVIVAGLVLILLMVAVCLLAKLWRSRKKITTNVIN